MIDKYFTCERKELEMYISMIDRDLKEVANYLVMFGQQFEGKRENMTINETKNCYDTLKMINSRLNEFKQIDKMENFEEAYENLEKFMKEDMY